MDDLLSEKEQIEKMREWWAENGRYVIGGIIIGAGLLFGWNQYQSSKLNAEMDASRLFETLAGHVADGDLEDARSVADELATNFANTSYAAQSKLAMARLYMDKNRDQDAADVLKELLQLRGNDELKHVGRLRLAKILLYQDRADDVVATLADRDSSAFAALYSETLGDAYAALGRYEDAANAYRRALEDPFSAATIDRALVQMKLLDLPDSTPATAEAAPAEAEAGDSE